MPGILHLATERGWRGGENQLRLLLEGLASGPYTQHVAARRGDVASQRLAQHAKLVPFDVAGKGHPIVAYRLARYCREHKIGLVDAHSGHAHTLALMIRAFAPELKIVVHRRVDNPPRRDALNLWKYRTPRVDRYVAISQAIRKELLALAIASERISVVRSAVPASSHAGIDRTLAKKQLAKISGADPRLPFIGNASALSAQKGHDVLLRAFRLLKDQGVAFHGYIAGDGALRAELEALRSQLGLDHNVAMLGFVHEVPSFLAALDVLAVPSRNEGLGTILLDGVHAGCTLVGTRVGGIPEIVIDEKTGLLVEAEQEKPLATALVRVAQDQSLRERLSRGAQNWVAQEFSVEAMVAGNLSIYKSLYPPDRS